MSEDGQKLADAKRQTGGVDSPGTINRDIDNLPPVLLAHEVASLARVSVKTIRRMVKSGVLKPLSGTGRAHRFPRQSVLDWLSGNDCGPTARR